MKVGLNGHQITPKDMTIFPMEIINLKLKRGISMVRKVFRLNLISHSKHHGMPQNLGGHWNPTRPY